MSFVNNMSYLNNMSYIKLCELRHELCKLHELLKIKYFFSQIYKDEFQTSKI